MEIFERQIANGYVIETVNLSEATVSEAMKFKKILDLDIELGFNSIIVDLTRCNSLDSAFIGVLVVILKKMIKLNGSLKIVKPGLFTTSLLTLTGTLELFEMFESIDEAINSYSNNTTLVEDYRSFGLDRLALAQ